MVSAWGYAFIPGHPFFINVEGTGTSEIIDGKGFFTLLPFATRAVSNGTDKPTGIIANSGAPKLL
jgi:hypothetical protein